MIDQIEFENCIEKMKKRKAEGDIKTATKIADKVPWDEVDDVNTLIFVAGIYEEAENFRDAKTVLEYAYDVAPIKNRLYFALSLINIKCKNINDGVNYYIDFCKDFPDDNRKNLLMYYILKAKGATYDQQKRILSEYLKEEKDEKMTFELALLSDKLNEKDDVISYCDFIINFYGVKKTGYGKNALLLKKKYVPLTDDEENLLVNAEIGYIKDGESEYEYKESPKLYNETRIEEDKVNIPIEKVERITNIEEQKKIDEILNVKNDDLDEDKVPNKIQISYMPDIDSYSEKEKKDMAFLNKNNENKEKLKKLIQKLKAEEKIENSPFNDYRKECFDLGRRLKTMKLSELKLHMIIEAYSKEEGVEIAQKELNYIHKFLNEKAVIAKASAYNMNEKGFDFYAEKIANRDLLIENAGQLKNEIIDAIEEYIINKKSKTIFVLIDVINNFDKLANERPTFINRFDVYSVLSNRPQESLVATSQEKEAYKNARDLQKLKPIENKVKNEKIIPKTPPIENKEIKKPENVEIKKETTDIRTNMRTDIRAEMSVDDFVEECKNYIKSIDCSISGNTIPALYEKVEEMQEEHIPLTKENVVALIEEVADRAEKPKLFSRPKYDKEGCLILSEEHFKF